MALENLEILRSNGFEVDVDEAKPPGRGERISLVAMPVSKETTFDFKGQFPSSLCSNRALNCGRGRSGTAPEYAL